MSQVEKIAKVLWEIRYPKMKWEDTVKGSWVRQRFIDMAQAALDPLQPDVSGLVEALEAIRTQKSVMLAGSGYFTASPTAIARQALTQHREGKQPESDPLAHWPKWKRDMFYKWEDEFEAKAHPPKGEE